jgi:hypothetical protein
MKKWKAIRLRTIILTLMIAVALVLYLLVNVITKQKIDFIDFIIVATLQIVTQGAYFPDGELFGQQDEAYISNHTAYNDKATDINEKGKFARLREYCEYEYQKRKTEYIVKECSYIGITQKELDDLNKFTEEEIKALKFIETEQRIVHLNKSKKKHLYKLLFCELPVQKNQPETIMSAIENNGYKAINDKSVAFKKANRIATYLKAIVMGGFLAYVGYTAKDGLGIEEIVKLAMFFGTIVTTAVTSFTGGETATKVYKKQFYIELSNFIDGFNEWDKKENAK